MMRWFKWLENSELNAVSCIDVATAVSTSFAWGSGAESV